MRFGIRAKIILIGAGLSVALMVAAFLFSFFIYRERTRSNFNQSLEHCTAEFESYFEDVVRLEDISAVGTYVRAQYAEDPTDEGMDAYLAARYQSQPEELARLSLTQKKYVYYSGKKYGQLYPGGGIGIGLSMYSLQWRNTYYQTSAQLATAFATQGVHYAFVAWRDEDRDRYVYLIDSNYRLEADPAEGARLAGDYYQMTDSDGANPDKGDKEFFFDGHTMRYFDLYHDVEIAEGVFEKEYVATVFIEYDEKSLVQSVNTFLYLELIALSVVTVLLVAAYALLVHFALIKNITKLTDSTKSFTDKVLQGDKLEVIDPQIKALDELGLLSSSFVTLEDEIIRYTLKIESDAKERERVNAELAIATEIQMEALPSPRFEDDKARVEASVTPAKEVGGDFYDYFYLDGNRLAVVIADVTGKGVPAALFMMKAKGLIKNALQSTDDLGAALTLVNDELMVNNKAGLFVTAFVGVIDLDSGEMTYCSAGHERPYLLSREGVERMEVAPNFVLGGIKGFPYRASKCKITGKRLFMYTDGLNEGINSLNEEFGYDRIYEVLRECNAKGLDVLPAMRQALSAFVGGEEPFDDVTMLLFAPKGEPKGKSYHVRIEDPDFGAIEQVTDAFNSAFAHLDASVLGEFDVIFDELLNNLVSYEKTGKDFAVEVDAKEQDDNVVLTVSSNGAPFDPLAVKPNVADETLVAGSGLGGFGITIVKSLCASVSYERNESDNVLTLVKSTRPKG